jgi:hypothetical protein
MVLTHCHVVGGMIVEIAGTEHVAAASFDVAGRHIKIGFGSLLLRGRSEIDEASGKRKERKHQDSRQTWHFFLLRKFVVKGPTKVGMSLRPGVSGDKPNAALASTTAIGPRVAAVELFDVELGRRELAARAELRAFRTQVAFVCGISTPFAEAAPEAAEET